MVLSNKVIPQRGCCVYAVSLVCSWHVVGDSAKTFFHNRAWSGHSRHKGLIMLMHLLVELFQRWIISGQEVEMASNRIESNRIEITVSSKNDSNWNRRSNSPGVITFLSEKLPFQYLAPYFVVFRYLTTPGIPNIKLIKRSPQWNTFNRERPASIAYRLLF